MKTAIRSSILSAVLLALGSSAALANISYVDWQSQDANGVYGVITFPDASTVNVTYRGPYFFAQLNNTGTYYWTGTVHTGPGVPNAPATADIIALVGGQNALNHSLLFSSPVSKPVMQLLSLGQTGGYTVKYSFDQSFTVVNQGGGYWGGGSLTQNGNDIVGEEGHGVIRFDGNSVSSVNWTTPDFEVWHGFTVGVEDPVGAVPEVGTWMSGIGALAAVAFSMKARRKA